jgi:hypothetical protein
MSDQNFPIDSYDLLFGLFSCRATGRHNWFGNYDCGSRRRVCVDCRQVQVVVMIPLGERVPGSVVNARWVDLDEDMEESDG